MLLLNSFQFIFLFFPAVLLVFFLCMRSQRYNLVLVSLIIASLVFYALWDLRYVPVLLFSICFNFIVGRLLSEKKTEMDARHWASDKHCDSWIF